jgi:hypothetical protein
MLKKSASLFCSFGLFGLSGLSRLLVCLVCLVFWVEPDQPDRPDEPDRPDIQTDRACPARLSSSQADVQAIGVLLYRNGFSSAC